MPFFSVIIPLYNKEKYISSTLKSVLNQNFKDFEVLIINDGSTDKSEDIVASFTDQRIKYFKQDNAGVSSARNFGITNASGEYITFIDADDYWYPSFLSNFKQIISENSSDKVFAAAIELETETKTIPAEYSISNQIGEDLFLENYFEGSLLYSLICTSCAVFHKSIFKEIGGFDTTIKSGQDTDLWIRIGLHHKVLFLNKILATYVYDINSLSRNKSFKTIKLKYEKFSSIEETNVALKRFMDLNRYSEALNNKLLGNANNYHYLKSNINPENISLKKRILLNTPAFLLKFFLFTQPFLIKLGLRKTFYK